MLVPRQPAVNTAHRPLRGWFGGLATLLLSLTAACGQTPGSSPVIGSDLAARATSVCEAALASKQAWAAFPVPSFDPTHPTASALPQVATWLQDEVSPTFDKWLSDLQALGTPGTGQQAWSGVLAAVERIVDLNAAQVAAAKSGDSSAFATATNDLRASKLELEAATAAAGVPRCADVHK
jgi:hypothetical protein